MIIKKKKKKKQSLNKKISFALKNFSSRKNVFYTVFVAQDE